MPEADDNELDNVSKGRFFRKLARAVKKHIFTRKFAQSILIGQFLSILICGTAITSGILQENSVNIPTGQSFVNYILLAITFTSWNLTRVGLSGYKTILKDRGWKYLVLGILEVEGNFLVIKAYQFTSVTSVQLLDCLTIPTVLLLSKKFLKVNFKWSNYVGVVVCLLGAGLLVLADFLTDRYAGEGQSNTVLQNVIGDILVALGAIIYGILNVSQEFVISNHGSVEYLGVVGCFGSIVSAIQFAILEREELYKINFALLKVWLPLLLFSVCLYLFYCFMSYGINKTSAMAINLNLLSSDFFSLLVGLVVFKYKFNALYFGSFSLIIIGVVFYNFFPATSSESSLPFKVFSEPQSEETHYSNRAGPQQDDLEETPYNLQTKIMISTHL